MHKIGLIAGVILIGLTGCKTAQLAPDYFIKLQYNQGFTGAGYELTLTQGISTYAPFTSTPLEFKLSTSQFKSIYNSVHALTIHADDIEKRGSTADRGGYILAFGTSQLTHTIKDIDNFYLSENKAIEFKNVVQKIKMIGEQAAKTKFIP